MVALLGYCDLTSFEDITMAEQFVAQVARHVLLEELVGDRFCLCLLVIKDLLSSSLLRLLRSLCWWGR